VAADGNRVYVDPGAVPGLRDAFADALARVDREIELANAGLRVASWANDPVSVKATASFNNRSVDTDASALDNLRAYRDELSTAVDKLTVTAQQYHLSEQDNTSNVGKGESGTG
jgi:hypothetical protein